MPSPFGFLIVSTFALNFDPHLPHRNSWELPVLLVFFSYCVCKRFGSPPEYKTLQDTRDVNTPAEVGAWQKRATVLWVRRRYLGQAKRCEEHLGCVLSFIFALLATADHLIFLLIVFSVVVCLSITSQLNRGGSPYFQVSCWRSACSLSEEFQEKDADFIFGIQIQNTATQSSGSSSSSNSTNVLRGNEDRLLPIPDPVFLYIENKQILHADALRCCPPLIGCLVSSPQPHCSLCYQLQETSSYLGKSQMIPFLRVFACRYNFQ